PLAGADLRNREAAAGDHEPGRCERAAGRGELEPGRADVDRFDPARLPALHAAGFAFGDEHLDDLRARAVAEQLSLVLLVPGDAMALDEFDEVARRVAGQRRA